MAVESRGGGILGSLVSRFRGFTRSLRLGRAVEKALGSASAATRLEGVAGDALRSGLVTFQQEVRVGGRLVGELDAVTTNAIVEVTLGRGSGKVGQVQRLITNKLLNPGGKKVVVFGPNLKPGVAKKLEEIGAIVVRTVDELRNVALPE